MMCGNDNKIGNKKMMLLTKENKKNLPALYADEDTPCDENICQVKFFHPFCGMTWFATEFDEICISHRNR